MGRSSNCKIIWRLIWWVPVTVALIVMMVLYSIKEGPRVGVAMWKEIW